MSDSPFTLRWGILAPGWISSKFTADLVIPTSARSGPAHITHHILAVASSSSLSKSQAFIKEHITSHSASGSPAPKAYGDYSSLFSDQDVDVVYIGSPHSHHYRHAKLAIQSGKHVLCEKPITVNAAQAKELVALAKEKEVFLMEAVWTRFQPIAYSVQDLIASGAIGDIKLVYSDLNTAPGLHGLDKSHRLVNPDLAGGALLDLGPYPWTWLSLILRPDFPSKPPTVVGTTMVFHNAVDASTVSVLTFPPSTQGADPIQGIFTTGMLAPTTPERCVLIQGTKGRITIQSQAYRPPSYTYHSWDKPEDVDVTAPVRMSKIEFEPRPADIWGFAWEADEVALCIQAGKLESGRCPLSETVLMMEVFDEMRRQGGLVFPEAIEKLDA